MFYTHCNWFKKEEDYNASLGDIYSYSYNNSLLCHNHNLKLKAFGQESSVAAFIRVQKVTYLFQISGESDQTCTIKFKITIHNIIHTGIDYQWLG